jgi:hypothetical protein
VYACALALFGAFAIITPASAATDVAVKANTLRIVDAKGKPDTLDIRPRTFGYHVFDDLSRLRPGAGCLGLSRHHVLCWPMIDNVSVDSGAAADVILLDEVKVPVHVDAGDGDDLIKGGQATDHLNGEAGNDNVIGEGGNDQISGGEGDDSLEGGTGADDMTGGAGADTAAGESSGGDVLRGGNGPDLLDGGSGDDALQGGPGADVLVTGTGNDTASTGPGIDKVFGTSSDQIARCADPGDQVSTGSKLPPPGCGILPSTETVPEIWPPPPDELPPQRDATPGARTQAAALLALAARQRQPKPTGVTRVKPIHRRKAKTLVFYAPTLYKQPVRVRVRTYAKDGHQISMFTADVKTKQPFPFRNPGKIRGVWSAKARCCL